MELNPDWTKKDKELYRKAKADIQSGKSILKGSVNLA